MKKLHGVRPHIKKHISRTIIFKTFDITELFFLDRVKFDSP